MQIWRQNLSSISIDSAILEMKMSRCEIEILASIDLDTLFTLNPTKRLRTRFWLSFYILLWLFVDFLSIDWNYLTNLFSQKIKQIIASELNKHLRHDMKAQYFPCRKTSLQTGHIQTIDSIYIIDYHHFITKINTFWKINHTYTLIYIVTIIALLQASWGVIIPRTY